MAPSTSDTIPGNLARGAVAGNSYHGGILLALIPGNRDSGSNKTIVERRV
jgi:hypothetical protein